jgi:hypothetical protein
VFQDQVNEPVCADHDTSALIFGQMLGRLYFAVDFANAPVDPGLSYQG